MRSAWRTVEKRCEMRIVVRPRVAARMRSKISASPRTSSCAVGSSSSTTPAPASHGAQRPGERDALPLPAGQVGAARRSPWRASVSRSARSAGPGTVERGERRRRRPRRTGRRCRAAAARSGRSPGTRRSTRWRQPPRSRSRRSTPSTSIAPLVGSYSRHSSLASVVLPAPFWPTIASDRPAGIVRSSPSRTSGPPG